MMCLIAKNIKKVNTNTRFKNKLYSFDKSDAKNLNLPKFIENLKDENLYEIIPKLVKKYENNKYISYEREELEELKDFNDIEVLILIKFYKNQWSFKIPNEDNFFPSFVFTYNIEPLKKQCDKIISFTYDKIDSSLTKEQLKNSYTFNTLDVTYLLHYFVISHQDYKE